MKNFQASKGSEPVTSMVRCAQRSNKITYEAITRGECHFSGSIDATLRYLIIAFVTRCNGVMIPESYK